MQPALHLNEMTREQIRALAPETTVVLPTAATEQHGPHLPIMTDSLCCETVALRAAEQAGHEVPITVAPLLPYGSSHHHFAFPGVVSLSSAVFTQAVYELCESFTRSGFRRIFILNGHGGNDEAIRVVTRDIARATDATIGAASYWTVARESLTRIGGVDAVGPLPGHAGGFETSCVMALRPELIDQANWPTAVEGSPLDEGPVLGTRAYVQRHGRWKEANGYSDDAARAAPDAGRRFLALIVSDVAETLVAFHKSVD
jgi:creatinine amidohydrolase